MFYSAVNFILAVVVLISIVLQEIHNLNSTNMLCEDQWGVKRDPKTKDILINCYVKPTAHRTVLEDVNETLNIIRIQSPKVYGKGNRKLIVYLSRIFRVNRTELSVIKGQQSANKVVALKRKDFSVPSVVRWIAQHLPPEDLLEPDKYFIKGGRPDIYKRSN
ncbi:UPF0235 protein SO_3356-like [Lycorma delicatula]|uniref:UPF0235 protein SO_3356-like n=1 Tax=Lycorma delicatula TaxID=130591 RepID=UPI003F5152A8